MVNVPKIFENVEFGQVRIYTIGQKDLFVATDVAKALKYADPNRAVRDHVDEDDRVIRTPIPDSLGRMQETLLISESGVYSLIFGAKTEKARKFKRWVTNEVLPSIRKTGKYEFPQKEPTKKTAPINQVRTHYEAIKLKKELLNLNDSSIAMLINKTDENLGIMGQTIDYVPSNGVLKPISALLKQFGIPMSAQAANKRLLEKGLLRVCTRKSHKGEKKYYNITEKGMSYGENQVSPQNPSETQPMWYEDKFNIVADMIK